MITPIVMLFIRQKISKIHKGFLCMMNCHQNEKNGQKRHKTALISQFFSAEKVIIS